MNGLYFSPTRQPNKQGVCPVLMQFGERLESDGIIRLEGAQYARRGSNPQPFGSEPNALSIELRAHDEILP